MTPKEQEQLKNQQKNRKYAKRKVYSSYTIKYYIYLELEVQKLEELQRKLIEEREKLNEKLSKHEIYQIFMQKVLDASEEFSEVREIIDRYGLFYILYSSS